jgi:hypothetical protein
MKIMNLAILALISLAQIAPASDPMENQSPQIEARLFVSRTDPFPKETITLTLEIVTRNIEIDPQLDLSRLPDRDELQLLGNFEAMAVQRERIDNQEITRRKYSGRVRPMRPGTITLAPILQLTARQRVRSFFGSAVEVRPVSLQVPALALRVQKLPPEPEGFSGIIGNFRINIEADPLEIAPGDLVTIQTTLQGEGWFNEDAIPAMASESGLRTYRVRPSQTDAGPDKHVFTQTVVPLDNEIRNLPAITLIWFNTQTGTYQEERFGPFNLSYLDPQETLPSVPVNEQHLDTLSHKPTGNLHRKRGVLPQATPARMAPASTSKSTFTIPAMGQILILEHHQEWVLVDHHNNRGWIPSVALPAP